MTEHAAFSYSSYLKQWKIRKKKPASFLRMRRLILLVGSSGLSVIGHAYTRSLLRVEAEFGLVKRMVIQLR